LDVKLAPPIKNYAYSPVVNGDHWQNTTEPTEQRPQHTNCLITAV